MTYVKPVWAFYLLPTRAWELLAGCLIAVNTDHSRPAPKVPWAWWISGFSLALIVLTFVMVREGNQFPGLWAFLPVIGTVGVLIPALGGRGSSEKILSTASLVLVGRMSYSLYLWHWPIFSLIDYRMFLASDTTRLALKIGLSFLVAALSFRFIENPARLFLNRQKNMPFVFAFLICALTVCVTLGIAIRKTNYVSAKATDVSKGGLVFTSKTNANSVILMGDSNGSMYGKVMKEICGELGCKLIVITVDGGDPLPYSNVTSGRLWADSLALVQRERPDCLVLACSWESKLKKGKERLALAVEALKPSVGHLVILNQPPILPETANRVSIRQGARPPFYEHEEIRRRRMELNDYCVHFNYGNCSVVDIASHFQTTNGEVLFLDGQGRQPYHDAKHLSGYGADSVRSELRRAVAHATKASRQYERNL